MYNKLQDCKESGSSLNLEFILCYYKKSQSDSANLPYVPFAGLLTYNYR